MEPEKPKKFVSELNFSGDEAKRAYEEVISTCPNRRSSTKQDIKNTKKNVNISNVNINNVKKATTQSVKPVTINAIMKAVEQRDLSFLHSHIHQDNVNNTDSYGWTPLMLAAYCGFVDIVDFLLKSGANKRFREKSGLTAAQLALKKNYLDIVALLRKNSQSSGVHTVNLEALSINKKEDVVEEKSKKQTKETNFYCNICKGEFKTRNHENSILHLFNAKPKLPGAFFGMSKAGKGYQMLLSSGWDEESGLGRDGKGQKYPVKTVLKLDRKGLGMSTKVEARISHFRPGDVSAVKSMKPKMYQSKVQCKKDREKLLSREARKDRALRIALS